MANLPSGDRAALIGALAELALAIRRPHPTRIAVEGRSAAGKSTFADALAGALRGSGRQVLSAEVDNFHPPGHAARSAAGGYTPRSRYDEAYDYASFRRLLLAPIGPGGDLRPRLALHDSLHDRPIDAPHVVAAANALVVVDGAFLLRPEMRSDWDLSIWLDVSFETVLDRAVVRDAAWVGDPAKVRERYLASWIPTHRLHEATGARAAAHVIIDNETPDLPRAILQRPVDP